MDLVCIERTYKKKKIEIMVICIVLIISSICTANRIKNIKGHADCSEQFEEQVKQFAQKEDEKIDSVMEVKILSKAEKEQQTIEKRLPELTSQGRENISNIYLAEGKKVYLTFDDGPSQTITIPILDLLKEEKIKATFFVLGSRVELYPEIVKREYEEGHYIANHGYSHIYKEIYVNPQTVLDEYNKTNDAVKNAIGEPTYNSHLFRFPGGSVGGRYKEIKKEAINLLDSNDIMHIDWNALTGDAEGKNTKEEMIAYLKETIGEKSNIVILMHDAANKTATYEALPEIISYLRERGYEFCNFYDIIK